MKRLIVISVLIASFFGGGISFAQDLQKGAQAFFEKNYDVAYQELMPLAEEGEPMAEFLIGSMYSEGLGLPQDRKTGFVWMRRAADHGNVYAQALIGAMYRYGKGIPKDYDKAFKYFSLAADQGSEAALHGLAGLYHHGLGVEQDADKAISLYKHSAEAGMEDAYNDLGEIYEDGVIVNRDLERAKGWYRLAAVAGDSEGQENYIRLKKITNNEITNGEDIASSSNLDDRFSKAMDFIKEGDLKTGLRYLTSLVKEGHADSQFTLGMMHTLGEGLPVNRPEGLRLFRLAAHQGHGQAQHMAGLYTSVEGTKLYNREEAIKWLRLAADQGIEEAGELLAEMEAEDVDDPLQKEKKSPSASSVLSKIPPKITPKIAADYQKSLGAIKRKDYEVALEYLIPLVEQGHADSQVLLGAMYSVGNGVAKDDQEALRLYTLAAEQGHAKAQSILALVYSLIGSHTYDPVKAEKWLKLSAAQGDKYAIETLELFKEKGIIPTEPSDGIAFEPQPEKDKIVIDGLKEGIEAYTNQDYFTALELLYPLAEDGVVEAQFMMGEMFRQGLGVSQSKAEAVKWMKRAAEQGHAKARFHLNNLNGNASSSGKKTARNQTAAIPKPLRKPATVPERPPVKEQSSPQKENEVDFLAGSGSQPKGKNVSDIDDDVLKGIVKAFSDKDYKKAFNLLGPVAQAGHLEGQYLLAGMYVVGRGTSENIPKGIELFKQSAEGGFAKAQMRLSYMYFNAEVVPEDLNAAYYWARKAADQGSAEGQYMVGTLLATGERDPEKLKEAAKWFKRAAEQGDAPAQSYLALLLMISEDTLLEGLMWLSLATKQGNEEAQEYWDSFTAKMPEEDLATVRDMTRNCLAKNYQGC
ncbi:tetratricopeptide repeat protein [Kiloniella antarctica]|uniref:Tetratricopeptide repeat protein n=1 Tax=Kiloniella antarctica TaxID=1550907 RepID=A0ABW5BI44_9PROT